MIGQDFKTGKYLGYRALLNRGFSREHPPQDMDLEREKVVQEFIELWTTGLADAGVSPQKIYSHTAFLSRRALRRSGGTYMKTTRAILFAAQSFCASFRGLRETPSAWFLDLSAAGPVRRHLRGTGQAQAGGLGLLRGDEHAARQRTRTIGHEHGNLPGEDVQPRRHRWSTSSPGESAAKPTRT